MTHDELIDIVQFSTEFYVLGKLRQVCSFGKKREEEAYTLINSGSLYSNNNSNNNDIGRDQGENSIFPDKLLIIISLEGISLFYIFSYFFS